MGVKWIRRGEIGDRTTHQSRCKNYKLNAANDAYFGQEMALAA